MERSCRHRCTGDKPAEYFFFPPNNEESEWRSATLVLGVPRCQMRLPYLIARCAKWCHRHICALERLGAIKWPCARPYDRESIRYQRSGDGRAVLEVAWLYRWPSSRKQHLPATEIPGSDKSAIWVAGSDSIMHHYVRNLARRVDNTGIYSSIITKWSTRKMQSNYVQS